MRLKFILGLLVVVLLVLGGGLLLKQHLGNAPVPAPASSEAAAPPVVSNAVADVAPPPPPAPVSAAPVSSSLTPEQRQAAIDAELERLQLWSMNNDPASLSNILADLTGPEKEIREAAIEAAKQFGSTNAIPALKAAAVNSTDTDEQIAMLQAANFLSLPPLDFNAPKTPEEIQAMAQRQAAKEARRKANAQNRAAQSPPDQNPPMAPNP